MSSILGIDVSSHAIDMIALDETTDYCEWTHVDLAGETLFDRLRAVAAAMPTRGWYDDAGVCLIAIETPKTRFLKSAGALFPVYGAVVARLPGDIDLVHVVPTQWRKALGLKGNATKAEARDVVRPLILRGHDLDPAEAFFRWPQDAVDAFAIALTARNTHHLKGAA